MIHANSKKAIKTRILRVFRLHRGLPLRDERHLFLAAGCEADRANADASGGGAPQWRIHSGILWEHSEVSPGVSR